MIDVKEQTHLETVVSDYDNVVVVVTDPSWCRPCQQLEPHLVKLAGKGFNVAVVNINQELEWPMDYFNIRSVPVVMLYSNGEFNQYLASRTVVALEREINNAIGDSDPGV